MNLIISMFKKKKNLFGQKCLSQSNVSTPSLNRRGYFYKKTRMSFLSKLSKKLIDGQISKNGFSKKKKYFNLISQKKTPPSYFLSAFPGVHLPGGLGQATF